MRSPHYTLYTYDGMYVCVWYSASGMLYVDMNNDATVVFSPLFDQAERLSYPSDWSVSSYQSGIDSGIVYVIRCCYSLPTQTAGISKDSTPSSLWSSFPLTPSKPDILGQPHVYPPSSKTFPT